jgi:glycosyltransferase involved in cell wall biosynthesis
LAQVRRLVTLAHSYVVANNRRLAHELARCGGSAWQVTTVAPRYFHGTRDLRPEVLARVPEDRDLVEAGTWFSSRIHVFLYGREVKDVLATRPDVLHCWEEPFILAGGQVARWTPRETTLVFRTAQSTPPPAYPPPFRWVERYVLGRAKGWIASGRTVVDALRDRPGYRDRPHRLVPLGVDTEAFKPDRDARAAIRRRLGWDESVPVVGFLGRFAEEKGPLLLARVLERLKTPWRALFVGEGPLQEQLEQWGRSRGDAVRVVTGVRHAEVPAWLNAMDVLACPSLTTPRWKEQFGRMLIEGFACGVPVVASDSGEIPNVVTGFGQVVAERDEHAWIATLDQLLADPARRAELGQKGLDRARAVYRWEAVARQYLDFFEQLLGAPAVI